MILYLPIGSSSHTDSGQLNNPAAVRGDELFGSRLERSVVMVNRASIGGISSGSRSGKLCLRRLSKFLQRRARWCEKRCAGVRGGEIEQPVVSARRVADIHSLQHLLDHSRISRITDKIRAELALPRTTKWHVVAKYVVFIAVSVYDGRQ
jgi:hypothetical protein